MSQKKATHTVTVVGLMMVTLFVVAACVPKTPPSTTTSTTSSTTSTTAPTTTTTESTTTTSTIPSDDGPIAVLSTQNATSGAAPLVVRFSSEGSRWDTSDPQNCQVDLGQEWGLPVECGVMLQRAATTYLDRRPYTATLTVKGVNGETATDTLVITPSGDYPALNSPPLVTPNPIPVVAGQTSAELFVRYTVTSEMLAFLEVCKKSISDITFDVSDDCAPLSRVSRNGTTPGANAILYEVFRGDNPDGETPWGCYAEGDTAPPGYEKFTTCYIRVTNNSLFNFADDSETAFSFVAT